MKAVPGREAERGGRNLGPWRAAGSRDIVVAWGPLSFNHNVKEMEIFLSAVVTKVSLLHPAKPIFSIILYVKELISDIKDSLDKNTGHFPRPQIPFCWLFNQPSPTLNPHRATSLPSAPLELPFAECHADGITASSVWLLSRRVTHSGSAHGAVRLWSAPLFCCSPFAQTGHSLLIHLPAEGHLGCSSFGAVRN